MKEMAGFLPGPLRIFVFRFRDHRRSVAILPSALLIEHICSVPVGRFSFQWVLQPECRSLTFRQADQEPELSRSHPNSAILLVCILSIRMDSD
jgi:hypothetical protein